MTSPMPLEDLSWSSDGLALIARLAESETVFDAYSLERDHGLRPPPHPNQWGGLFQAAYKAHIATPIGFKQSERPGRAGGVCRVWRGLPNNTRKATT